MGITHGWLLSQHHDVSWLVRADRADFYREPFELRVHDLRPGRRDTTATVALKLVTSIAPDLYDAVLVMVPGGSLADVLPVLDGAGTDVPVVLMLNHWNLAGALGGSSEPRANRLLGFPSQVGGGRQGHRISVTVFPRGTVLEAGTASKKAALDKAEALLASGGLTIRRQRRMPDWLAVHSMQQALTAASLIEAGSYRAFAADRAAIARMVVAFREGLDVCRARGIRTWRLWPAPLFTFPKPLVARLLQGMFQRAETEAMVVGHMGHGLDEWIEGLESIRADAQRLGVPAPEIDRQWAVIRSRRSGA